MQDSICNFRIFIELFVWGEGKVVPSHAMKSWRGTGGRASIIRIFGTRQVCPSLLIQWYQNIILPSV